MTGPQSAFVMAPRVRGTLDMRRPAKVMTMVADALAPNMHQTINNHNADLTVTMVLIGHITQHAYSFTTIDYTNYVRAIFRGHQVFVIIGFVFSQP